MSFCIQEHTSFGVPCEKRNRKVFPLFFPRTKKSACCGGLGALYPDNEALLGVSDVGQVTRGCGIINTVCFLILCVCVFMLTWHYT